ncbi:MAG: SRPBCC family protein [bacterium]
MFYLEDETIIDASADKVFRFLTNINKLYKQWHPKEHVFCAHIRGPLDKEKSLFHFFEFVGWLPLYLIVRVKRIESGHLIEDELFPLTSLGSGGFIIETISPLQVKLIAYAHIGYNNFGGKILDWLIGRLNIKGLALRHMKEEGENIKLFLRDNPNF